MKYYYPPQETDMKTLAHTTAALALGFTLGILATAYAEQPKATIKTYDCDTLQDIPSELYFNPTAANTKAARPMPTATQRHHAATAMGKRPDRGSCVGTS